MTIEETQSRWEPVRQMMENAKPITIPPAQSAEFKHCPQHLLNTASYYKFAAKMIGQNKSVLDLNCNDGLGTWILAKEAGYAKGIGQDKELIQNAKQNFADESNIEFECTDLNSLSDSKKYDAIVCMNLCHLASCDYPGELEESLGEVKKRLSQHGIVIFGIGGDYALIKKIDQFTGVSFDASPMSCTIPGLVIPKIQENFSQTLLFGAVNEYVYPTDICNTPNTYTFVLAIA